MNRPEELMRPSYNESFEDQLVNQSHQRNKTATTVILIAVVLFLTAVVLIIVAVYNYVQRPPSTGGGGGTQDPDIPITIPPTDPPIPSEDLMYAALTQRFYVNEPQIGTLAESFYVPLSSTSTGRLTDTKVRVEQPCNTDSAVVQLWRYRKETSGGALAYTNITTPFTLNNTSPWSLWIDMTPNILPGLDLNPVTDMIVATLAYTLPTGDTSNLRAVTCVFTVDPV